MLCSSCFPQTPFLSIHLQATRSLILQVSQAPYATSFHLSTSILYLPPLLSVMLVTFSSDFLLSHDLQASRSPLLPTVSQALRTACLHLRPAAPSTLPQRPPASFSASYAVWPRSLGLVKEVCCGLLAVLNVTNKHARTLDKAPTTRHLPFLFHCALFFSTQNTRGRIILFLGVHFYKDQSSSFFIV